MGESSINENENSLEEVKNERKSDIVEISRYFLEDLKEQEVKEKSFKIPIVELSSMGMACSSLMPFFNTVTTTLDSQGLGLYKLANAAVGDTLKVAKNGNFWGAFKTVEGGSKFAQLQGAGQISSKAVTAFNPATIMMAAAIITIDQKLKHIEETGKQILSFLETEKESEIEADLEVLLEIISKYKFNWDNEHFIASNHKLVLDIQRTARKNVISYTKKIKKEMADNKFFVMKGKVDTKSKELVRLFKYYRLSLYILSLASLTEVLLSGDFNEGSINYKLAELDLMSNEYRNIFSDCSYFLEKKLNSSLDVSALKGAGKTMKSIGGFIAEVPVLKETKIDDFLQESGDKLSTDALDIREDLLKSFSEMNNPGIKIITERMHDIAKIYSHTDNICFDNEYIYLIEG